MKEGADIDKTQNDGRTPLFFASQEGKVEVVEVLLKEGADIDKAQNEKETPLLIASCYGHKEVVEVLLAYGAKVTDDCIRLAKTEEIKQLLSNPPKQTKWPVKLVSDPLPSTSTSSIKHDQFSSSSLGIISEQRSNLGQTIKVKKEIDLTKFSLPFLEIDQNINKKTEETIKENNNIELDEQLLGGAPVPEVVNENASQEIKYIIEEHKIERDSEKKQELLAAKKMLAKKGIALSTEEQKDIEVVVRIVEKAAEKEVKEEKERKGVSGGISKLFSKVKKGAEVVKGKIEKASEKVGWTRDSSYLESSLSKIIEDINKEYGKLVIGIKENDIRKFKDKKVEAEAEISRLRHRHNVLSREISSHSAKEDKKEKIEKDRKHREEIKEIEEKERKWDQQIKIASDPLRAFLEGFRDWKKRSFYDLVRSYVSSSLMIHEALALGGVEREEAIKRSL